MTLKKYDNEVAQQGYLRDTVEQAVMYSDFQRNDRTPDSIQESIRFLKGDYMDSQDFKDTLYKLYGDRLS